MNGELFFVELAVADLDRSLAWYEQGLGLTRLPPLEEPHFALLGTGNTRLALKAGRPAPGGVLLSFRVDDLDAEVARLAERGILPVDGVKLSPEGYRRARLVDPDGHAVTLFEWAEVV